MTSLSAWRKVNSISRKQTPDTVREGTRHGIPASPDRAARAGKRGAAQKARAYPKTTEDQIPAAANHGSHMHKNEVTPQMASFFYSHFRGRKDVYSVRSRPKDGKTGCFPVCDPICPPRGQFGALRGGRECKKVRRNRALLRGSSLGCIGAGGQDLLHLMPRQEHGQPAHEHGGQAADGHAEPVVQDLPQSADGQ